MEYILDDEDREIWSYVLDMFKENVTILAYGLVPNLKQG